MYETTTVDWEPLAHGDVLNDDEALVLRQLRDDEAFRNLLSRHRSAEMRVWTVEAYGDDADVAGYVQALVDRA